MTSHSVVKGLKRGTLHALRGVGGFRMVSGSRWRRERLTILCYHGISLSDEHEWNSSYYLDPTVFEDRMRMLRRGGYSVVSLDEGLKQLHAGTLPRASVAVTFDDGMYDFYLRAHPVLQRYEIPATVYLTTYYLDYNRPVFGPCCAYLLWKGRDKQLDLGRIVPGKGTVDLASDGARQRAFRDIVRHASSARLSAEEKDALAASLARELGVDHAAVIEQRLLHVMNSGEVRELASRGIDFQLHTHRHRTPLDREKFLREINDNRTRIRELVGHDAVHFCYPSGFHRPEFLPWLEESGVISATTCDPGMATMDCPSLLLPRIVDGGQLSPIELEGWLSGLSAFLPRRPQRSFETDEASV